MFIVVCFVGCWVWGRQSGGGDGGGGGGSCTLPEMSLVCQVLIRSMFACQSNIMFLKSLFKNFFLRICIIKFRGRPVNWGHACANRWWWCKGTLLLWRWSLVRFSYMTRLWTVRIFYCQYYVNLILVFSPLGLANGKYHHVVWHWYRSQRVKLKGTAIFTRATHREETSGLFARWGSSQTQYGIVIESRFVSFFELRTCVPYKYTTVSTCCVVVYKVSALLFAWLCNMVIVWFKI